MSETTTCDCVFDGKTGIGEEYCTKCGKIKDPKRLFLVPMTKDKRESDLCFKECGKIHVGLIFFDGVYPCLPCWTEDCPHEENRVDVEEEGLVECHPQNPVTLRKLKKKEG